MMNEKRFKVDVDHLLLVWDTEKNKRLEIEDIVDLLNEQQATIQSLNEENGKLRMKIVSLENEVQRQINELKNTRKEFTKKTEELNWLKSEDYLKKIY